MVFKNFSKLIKKNFFSVPVQGKRKPVRNVFTRMENIKGPLERLKTCVEKRTKIKVNDL